MIYQAKVLQLDNDIEEQVTLQIGNIQLTCFAGICPYKIREGLSYPVELKLVVFYDYYVVESLNDNDPAFVRIGNGFSYLVRGRLNGTYLDVGGLIFEDEVLQRDFCYLDNKIVVMKVDRLDVEFLRH